MAKTNPFNLKRPPVLTESRTFTDPAQPGASWEFVFSVSPDGARDIAVQGRASVLRREYVTGDSEFVKSKGESGTPPAPVVHPIDFTVIQISALLCNVVASLIEAERAAVGEDGEALKECWGEMEWFAFASVAPTAFEDVTRWHDEMYGKASDTHRGNASPARGAAPSGSPSISEAATTPN